MSPVYRGLGVVLAVAVLACEAPSAPSAPSGYGTPLLIRPATATLAPGSTVDLRLLNLGSRSIEHGLCPAALFRATVEGSWAPAYTYTTPCPAVLLRLKGHGATRLAAAVPTDLEPGRYRVLVPFQLVVDDYRAPLQELSEPFTVARPAGP